MKKEAQVSGRLNDTIILAIQGELEYIPANVYTELTKKVADLSSWLLQSVEGLEKPQSLSANEKIINLIKSGQWQKLAQSGGKAVYTDAERPCPKCGNPEHYIANASTPIINECTKCKHKWNPDYEK